MEWNADHLFRLVEASPAMVAAHDKEGWLSLFSSSATVEDPVGTSPHRKGAGCRKGGSGNDELGRFYDVFIGPNEIGFEVRQDIVAPPFVVRDVVIQTRLAGGLSLEVPSYLLYEIRAEQGELKIERLAAHWELSRLSRQALMQGPKGLWALSLQTLRMLQIQRAAGMVGYMKGMARGIGAAGKDELSSFAEAVTAGNPAVLGGLFIDSAPRIELSIGGARLDASGLVDALGPEPSLSFSEPRSAGWTSAATFVMNGRSTAAQGIAIFEFSNVSRSIALARFFVDQRGHQSTNGIKARRPEG